LPGFSCEPINNPGVHIYDYDSGSTGRIYLATWMRMLGGIYRSDDNGETWQQKTMVSLIFIPGQ
jgi:hypothetical protein